ncbi:hypothetical protein [Gordonia aquimaris]|uniref:DUF8176 domain-containing protein n=1 Tax=Gordonia aquimaris TaxID=2984863 RepID=A0A9X3D9T8_9ACTN|nr:hypothetical protein [Gordonia aquimaris]MCX2966262.1 hypothetical protein [Gordonia aquimaris]
MSTWQNDPSVQSWLHTTEPHPDQPSRWDDEPTSVEQVFTASIDEVDDFDEVEAQYADGPHDVTETAEGGVESDPYIGHGSATAVIDRRATSATPPAQGRRRWMVVVASSVAVVVVAVLLIAFAVKALFGGAGVDGITDPVAAMDTPDPFSDAVECPSTSEGATTTGRDPGDLTSGPNVIKAFNYAYFHWRSGPAARALASSNVEGIGSAVDLQSSIDTLNPQARYCLSIDETGANTYRAEITLILPDGTRDPDPDVQNITTTQIGERTYIASVTRDKK